MNMFTYLLNYIIALFLYYGFPIIFIPIIYYNIEETFLARELKRIFYISFSFNYKDIKNFSFDIGNLIFGYMVFSFFIAYTLREIYESVLPMGYEIHESAIRSLALTSLAISFSTRYISRKKGYEKGKQIFYLLSSAASIIFMIGVFAGMNRQYFNIISGPIPFIDIIFLYFNYLFESFINHAYDLAIYMYEISFIIFIGSCINAFLGEYILEKNNNMFVCNRKNIYGFTPQSSMEFKLIPYYRLASKMLEITKDDHDIVSIKIISHSLEVFGIIHANLQLLLKKSNPPEIKIIAPSLRRFHFPLTMVTYLFNIRDRNHFIKLQKSRYFSNYNNLEFLVENGNVKWVDKDLKEFNILIVNNNKCLLIVDTNSPLKRKIGLYSENPELIVHFIKIFEDKFN